MFNFSSTEELIMDKSTPTYEDPSDMRLLIDSLLFDTEVAYNQDDSPCLKSSILESPKVADWGITSWKPVHKMSLNSLSTASKSPKVIRIAMRRNTRAQTRNSSKVPAKRAKSLQKLKEFSISKTRLELKKEVLKTEISMPKNVISYKNVKKKTDLTRSQTWIINKLKQKNKRDSDSFFLRVSQIQNEQNLTPPLLIKSPIQFLDRKIKGEFSSKRLKSGLVYSDSKTRTLKRKKRVIATRTSSFFNNVSSVQTTEHNDDLIMSTTLRNMAYHGQEAQRVNWRSKKSKTLGHAQIGLPIASFCYLRSNY